VLALLGSAAIAGGLWGGYAELLAAGVLAAVVLAAAIVIPQVGTPVDLDRVEVPRIVSRGTSMAITLRAVARRRVPGVRIVDQFASLRVPVELPPLERRRPLEVTYGVRATTRGVRQLGPILEERTDPFGLAVRSIVHPVHDEVIVTPVVHRVRIRGAGERERRHANMVPRISDDPLADFRALREYQPGDDPRAVHWPSSARLGTLVVKDYLQLRRTRRAVVLETAESSISALMFEEAVDIAATLAIDALEQSIVLTVRTRDAAQPGWGQPVQYRNEVLDLLARVERVPPPAALDPKVLLRPLGDGPDQLFLVMGASSPLLGPLAANPLTRQALIVVRVGQHQRHQALPRLPVPTVDVRSAREFALAMSR
jgi:uncharacterized protein (DUF58 family)